MALHSNQAYTDKPMHNVELHTMCAPSINNSHDSDYYNQQEITYQSLSPQEEISNTSLTKACQSIGQITSIGRTHHCNVCGSKFNNSSNLKSHLRIHTGERPYTCDECGASFVQSSNMKAHKRTHTGERPYICHECGQTFSRSSHLIGHMRRHTGERPYICGICNEAFVTSTHLRNHMRKHTGERPFVCTLCLASFSQNSSLQIHNRIHTGERPFKCDSCSLAFRSKGDLRSHVLLHTDSREFFCTKCSKSFKTKQYLLKHSKKCGFPPSGKRRGRPKKSVNSVPNLDLSGIAMVKSAVHDDCQKKATLNKMRTEVAATSACTAPDLVSSTLSIVNGKIMCLK